MLYLKVNSCMIKGIGGQPYIALDEHIDIEGFRNLHPEICRGFALAREYAKEGTWMSPGFDPKDKIAIFRIPGSWEEEGFKILDKYGVEYVDRSVSMFEAANRAVQKMQ